MKESYLDINKKLWNEKTAIHVRSDFYELEDFMKGKSSLKDIELAILGDIKGKSILHLQCHFGQDSLSLARMGAKVTGVDISDKSIEKAIELNEQLGLDAEFFCCDVYSSKDVINKKFDIVFSSYGTIGWLPDIEKWADIVSHFIKPEGRFVFAELHPAIWMYDAEFKNIIYSYFNGDPIVETTPGTYADQSAAIEMKEIGWNHALSEVIGALLRQGLTLNHFEEFNYSPHHCFQGMKELSPGKYIIAHIGDKLPMTYALEMIKK
ncbi:MAG: class I SAM-dependent methyltransferase [Bacteroidia bacterium]|nr:class I SAM-dependent methyltransferase [Bacteroidia bacterium]NNJ55961.1 methyltransferase domain-containing protein [Bacteroidia bacterium]